MEVDASIGPIRRVLNLTGKSLRTTADETGINYQTLYLADCGCYHTLPPAITNWMLKSLPDETTDTVNHAYREYQRMKRGEYPIDLEPDHIPPVGNPVFLFRTALGLSRSGFSKKYCVPAALMYSLEQGHKPPEVLSPIFVRAIREAGASKSLIERLQSQFVRWRNEPE